MGGITAPTLYDKTYSTLFAEALARIAANAPSYTARVTADPGIALLDAMIYELHQLGIAMNQMPAASLVAWLNYLGIDVKGAAAAKVLLSVELEAERGSDYTIPAGSRFLTANGLSFKLAADVVIPAGETEAEFEVECETRGLAGNVKAHTITIMYSNLPYVAVVDNAEAAAGGFDSELDADALERGRTAFAHLYRAVTPADYEHLALDVEGVGRAKATDAPGQVNLYVLNSQGEAATSTLIASILAYLNGLKTAGCALSIYPASFVQVDVTAQVKFLPGFIPSTVKNAIAAKLDDFFNPLTWAWGGANEETRGVYLSEVITLFEETAGVDYLNTLVFPTANVRLEKNQLPVLGEVTINAL